MQIACACTARCMLGLVVGADRPAKHASLGLVGYAQGLPGRGSRGLYMEPMSGRDVGESCL